MADGPLAVLDRLVRATNDHDLEALVACFAEDYVNETPVHPARSFKGREQVRRNWEQIFAFVPDLSCEIVGRAVDGGTVWTELRMSGTRRDGSTQGMSGVVIFETGGAVFVSARFFLEPVDDSADGVDEAIKREVVR